MKSEFFFFFFNSYFIHRIYRRVFIIFLYVLYERKLWKNKEASHIYVEFIKFVEKNIDFICSYRVQQWSGKVDKEDTVS